MDRLEAGGYFVNESVSGGLLLVGIGTSEVDGPTQGSPKRRRTELLLGGARDRPVQGAGAPECVPGTAPRGKRKRAHRPAADAKRRREAAAAAFDGTDSDEDGPAPAGPAPFAAPEVEEPDNPMDVG